MSIRRKPEFERFNAGLSKRVESVLSDDWEPQDLVNMVRSECSRNWKYLIEKVNKLEHENKILKKVTEPKEIDSLKKQLDEAVKVIEFYGDEDNWDTEDPNAYWCNTIWNDGGMDTGHIAREFLQKMKETK